MSNLKRLLWVVVCGGFAVSLLTGCGGGGGGQKPPVETGKSEPVKTVGSQSKTSQQQPKAAEPAGTTKIIPPIDTTGMTAEEAEAAKAKAEQIRKMELIRNARDKMNNVEWKIKLTPTSGENKKTKTDTLVFVDRKVYSKAFEAKGYTASNYSLRIKKDDTIVWETMQRKEDEGVLFWRGDWREDELKGSLSNRPKGEKSQEFSFVSVSSKKIKGKDK